MVIPIAFEFEPISILLIRIKLDMRKKQGILVTKEQ